MVDTSQKTPRRHIAIEESVFQELLEIKPEIEKTVGTNLKYKQVLAHIIRDYKRRRRDSNPGWGLDRAPC